mgnify:CR=1 FL=1
MRGKKLLATLAVSAVLFAGCGLKSQEAIIKVNDKKITQAQFDKMFDKQSGGGMLAAMGIDVKKDKNSFIYLLIKERVINELIVKARVISAKQLYKIKPAIKSERNQKEINTIVNTAVQQILLNKNTTEKILDDVSNKIKLMEEN